MFLNSEKKGEKYQEYRIREYMPGSVLDRKERKKPVTNTKKEKEVKEKKREGKIRATKEKEGYLEARKAHTKQYNVPVALERRSSGGLNPWSCRKLLSHLRGHKREKNGNRHSRRWSSLSTTATATKRERERLALYLSGARPFCCQAALLTLTKQGQIYRKEPTTSSLRHRCLFSTFQQPLVV